MAAVPSIGRASRVERPITPGAEAAGELYERFSPQIYSYCMHQLGSREEAEDAVQTTFMNAFRGLQRGIVPELESAWLFKIAHNVCLSRRRSSWRRGRVEAPNNFEVLQEIVPGRDQVADELIRLQDVLEEMPENQRRAILLREWQGLTYREISMELELSQAAVETLIFRARRALAQGLEQDADTWKRRLRRGADVGGALACAKALLGGGGAAAVKVAATALAVASAAVAVASAPSAEHVGRRVSSWHPKHTVAARHPARKLAATHAPIAVRSVAATKMAWTRAADSRPAERRVSLPSALPTSNPAGLDEASPPADPAASAPTQLAAAPAAASPESAAAPADSGRGKKNGKTERRPQATSQATDSTPAPDMSAPADTAAQPSAAPPAPDSKPAAPDHPNNGNGNGRGNGNK